MVSQRKCWSSIWQTRWGVPFLRGVFVGVFLKGIGFLSAFTCSEVLVSSVTSAPESSRMDWSLVGLYLKFALFRSSSVPDSVTINFYVTYNIRICLHLVLRSISADPSIIGLARQITIYTWKSNATWMWLMWPYDPTIKGRFCDFITTYITFYVCMLLYVDKTENNKKHKNFCLQIYLHIFLCLYKLYSLLL